MLGRDVVCIFLAIHCTVLSMLSVACRAVHARQMCYLIAMLCCIHCLLN